MYRDHPYLFVSAFGETVPRGEHHDSLGLFDSGRNLQCCSLKYDSRLTRARKKMQSERVIGRQ